MPTIKMKPKSQVPVFFDKWLDLMEKAYDELTYYEFRELEKKIKAEIDAHK